MSNDLVARLREASSRVAHHLPPEEAHWIIATMDTAAEHLAWAAGIIDSGLDSTPALRYEPREWLREYHRGPPKEAA